MLFYFSFIIDDGIQVNFLSKMWTVEVDHLIFVLNQAFKVLCEAQHTFRVNILLSFK